LTLDELEGGVREQWRSPKPRTAVRDMVNASSDRKVVKDTTGHVSDSLRAPRALTSTQAHRAASLADETRTVGPLAAARQ
jgi:hypothetical protein